MPKAELLLVVRSFLWRSLESGIGLVVLALLLQPLLVEKPTATVRVLAETRTLSTAQVRKQQSLATEGALQQQLQHTINDFATSHSGTYGIYVEHLRSDVGAAKNADRQFRTASIYKAFVAVEALRKVDAKEWSLTQSIDRSRGLNLAECLDIMITVSDNPCGQALHVSTNMAYASPAWLAKDFPGTRLHGLYPISTPRDVARLFKQIRNKAYLSDASSKLLWDLLLAQRINTRLPQQLPDNIRVAHKTGDLAGILNDAGIVLAHNGSYVIVLMSEDVTSTLAVADSQIARLSRQVYDLLTKLP